MDTRQIGPTPHPLLALGMIPERADHLPALPMVGRAEQAARERSAPYDAGLVGSTGLERPDACRAPIQWATPHVVFLVAFRLGRISRSSDLFPTRCRRAVELDAKMPVIESRIMTSVASVGQGDGDVVSQKISARDLPRPCLARHREQAFAGRNEKRVAHRQPPERAWMT